MIEFDAEARYGNHGANDPRWTEEQQMFVMQHQIAMLNNINAGGSRQQLTSTQREL